MVGVNYIISYQEHLLCRQRICKLAICDDMYNAIYFTWAIWLVRQCADTLVWLSPSFTGESIQTLFFDKAAGRTQKIWCLGTRLSSPLSNIDTTHVIKWTFPVCFCRLQVIRKSLNDKDTWNKGSAQSNPDSSYLHSYNYTYTHTYI